MFWSVYQPGGALLGLLTHFWALCWVLLHLVEQWQALDMVILKGLIFMNTFQQVLGRVQPASSCGIAPLFDKLTPVNIWKLG